MFWISNYHVFVYNLFGMRFWSIAGCGDPTPPVNGSIVKFTSAVVGSQLLYSCGPKLLPEGLMTSNCGLNRSWRPNPAEFKCRKPSKLHFKKQHNAN